MKNKINLIILIILIILITRVISEKEIFDCVHYESDYQKTVKVEEDGLPLLISDPNLVKMGWHLTINVGYGHLYNQEFKLPENRDLFYQHVLYIFDKELTANKIKLFCKYIVKGPDDKYYYVWPLTVDDDCSKYYFATLKNRDNFLEKLMQNTVTKHVFWDGDDEDFEDFAIKLGEPWQLPPNN